MLVLDGVYNLNPVQAPANDRDCQVDLSGCGHERLHPVVDTEGKLHSVEVRGKLEEACPASWGGSAK
jgi:hypothetical protein